MDEDVIHVARDMLNAMQDNTHQPVETPWGIHQTKRHYPEQEEPMSGSKSCTLLGPLAQWHLPKSTGEIHLRQVLCLGQLSKNECWVGDRFIIEHCPGIQLTAVKTETVSAISLANHQVWQTV